MNPRDHIRVRMNESGIELTILAGQFSEEHMTRLNKPALGKNGYPLPEKRHETPDRAKARRAARLSGTTAPKATKATTTKAEEA